MKKFEHIVKVCILIFSMLSINLPAWGATYEVSLAKTSTTTYTKDGEIKLTFSNVKKNDNGFELTEYLRATSEQDARRGSVKCDNLKNGYTIKITKAEATFKTNILSWLYRGEGRIYQGSYSAYTGGMYGSTNNPKTISISNNSGFGDTFYFTSGCNSVGGKEYLNKLKLTYSFTANTYIVKFNYNGGSGSMSDQKFTYDQAQNLNKNTFKRNGYTFTGWNTKQNGSGTSYSDEAYVQNLTTVSNGEVILYAQWTANNYTVTLESDIATNHGTESFGVTYDAATPALITPPSRDKYTFWGYYTGENGEGTQIIDRDGKVLKSKSGYTDGNCKWKYAGNITLHAHLVAKKDQTLTWDNVTNGNEYTTGTPGAVASSKLTVTYTYDHEEWAYINVNNRLVVEEPNKTVTITAHQDGNDYYNAAEPISRTFVTLGGHPNQYMDVQASNITYGDLLSDATLSGNVYLDGVVIPGTLEWVDPSIMPDAGTDEHMVLFTPTNTDAYSSVYFNVDVTVAKADPVFSWHISNALHEHTRFHDFVTSSNKETGFTYSVSDDTYIEVVDDGVLHTKEVESAQSNLKITVKQAETANYNMKEETKTVTVYPKVEQCLPAVINSETVMNHMGKVFDPANAGSWCDVTNVVDTTYLRIFDVKYTQYRGIRLGKWSEGFSGVTNIYEAYELVKNWNLPVTDKSIELTFTGIPDKISFSARLQTVQYKFFEWQTAPLGTAPVWKIYEKSLGGEYEEVTSLSVNDTENHLIEANLKPTTRFVKIELSSAFAGFAQNVTITRKQSIETDKASLVFGTNANPLQEPQTLTLTYSSIGDCDGETDENIVITSSNPAFYVDEPVITENVGVEQMDNFVIRVRCNDVNQTGTLTITGSDGTTATVALSSEKPVLTVTPTSIFETGTEHAPVAETTYRAKRTHDFSACFDGAKALYDTLYIYGVTESSATERLWAYDAHKGYNVPAINVKEGNVHTPCFVYTKNDTQYDYVRTFDAATTTLNIEASNKKLGFMGYKPASLATTIAANQINGANVELYLDNTEMVASGNVFALSGTATIRANKSNILMATNGAAVKLSDAPSQLTIEDTWQSDEASGLIALRPQAGSPSIDLGSASGKVTINGAQVELHNGSHLAIAHVNGNTEKYDGEVYINDGTIGGEVELGLPKMTRIDGGTFNDGTVLAYTIKGFGKRPRNSRGDMLSRHTMSPEALADKYSWYGHAHLTTDDLAKVHPMLMDEVVCIFEGTVDEDSHNESNWTKWPAADDDVLINAPMIITGAEMKVKSLTINWVRGEHGQPAVTVAPDGGLTVGEGGVDGAVKDNLLLKAGTEGATKGQTGFLRIHPEPNSWELMPQANVELFSIGYYDMNSEEDNVAAWQYVGVPVETSLLAKKFFTTSWIYSWNEEIGDWQNNRSTLVMQPFEGYATTQFMNKEGVLVSFAGTILDNKEYKVAVTANGKTDEKGYNALANSFTAPIDIAQFSTEDFSEGVDPTIYLFNTGSRTDASQIVDIAEKAEAKGQYLAVPVNNVDAMKTAYQYPTVIAPMQGFCIKTEKKGTVTMNYERLVWNGNYNKHPNTPLRTPKKAVNLSTLGSLCVTISANGWSDNLYMLESDSYDKAFEAGYDAAKMNSGEFNVFALEGESRLAVDATNNIIGTYVGVRTGEETTYTLSFSHLMTNNELFLLDKEANEIVDIYDGVEYTFYAEPNTEITERFQILGREKAPEVTTAIEEAADNDGAKVHKFIKDNQLYILKNGVLYNATGARVH